MGDPILTTEARLLGDPLTEGKTKQIYEADSPDEVVIVNKDDITAGDGARHDILPGKGIYSTATTASVFGLLQAAEIPTHFIAQQSPNSFKANKIAMLPLELVVRRRPFASYLKRSPEIDPRTEFTSAVFEVHEKNDALHDPLLLHIFASGKLRKFVADQPLAQGLIEERSLSSDDLDLAGWNKLSALSVAVFRILEAAWHRHNIVLADLKIECGYNAKGDLVVADVIDNDSWRLWPDGDPARALDKQVYRDLVEVTPEALAQISRNYALVAELSRNFVDNSAKIIASAKRLQTAGKN